MDNNETYIEEEPAGLANLLRTSKVAAYSAFLLLFGLAMAIPFAVAKLGLFEQGWEQMETPELRHEFNRAFATGSMKFLECSRANVESSCQEVGPILQDGIAMGEILCTRDPADSICGDQLVLLRDTAQLHQGVVDFTNQVSGQMEDLTSYEAR